jgi:hypothetical protein|tara:strand:+ start:57 stop:1229 length:1173 start_codon:yes stop_codon:yes gene_type:complete
MATFAQITNPTPFGFYDAEGDFVTEADNMVTFVKRKMGDDILSVELTKKQIFGAFEEAVLEYSSILNQFQAKSQLVNYLGFATGSADNPHMESNAQEKLPRNNLEYLTRFAEPYAMEAGVGGSYNTTSGSIELTGGQQDYDIYTGLKNADGSLVFNDAKGKIKIVEVFHFNPQAAYRFFDTTSAINYLNNEFSFESFTPETIFYVLPVFEDILRAGQLDLSNRVRRSNYSYRVEGTKIRLFPCPSGRQMKLWIRVRQYPDPLSPSYKDASIFGVSNMGNLPFGNIQYNKINSIGRQWIRQFTVALSREILGLIRSKFGSIPVPGAEVTLNGSELISQGREDKDKLITTLREMLDTMTYDKLIEMQATRAENMNKQLKYIPVPNGRAIFMG